MPKEKENMKAFIVRMAAQFPSVFRADQSVLFCNFCNSSVNASKMFTVKQHLQTTKHKEAEEKRKHGNTGNQALISEYNIQPKDTFSMELCETLIKANIPIKKVSQIHFRKFLEKYTHRPMPCESTVRQHYVPILYNKCINDLRAKAENKYIWISIDETTDPDQRLIVNLIFGILNGAEDSEEEQGKSYLFNVAEVDAANSNTMATFINDSLSLLWPKGNVKN